MSNDIKISSDKNQRIAKNTTILYFRMLLTMGISLYTSRIILSQLGFEDYGIYNVVGSVIGMFTFVNGALSLSTSRFITFELGKNNHQRAIDFFRSAITIQLLFALVVLLFAETVGLWFINTHLIIPVERISVANIIYQLIVLNSTIIIIQIPLTALIIADERMSIYAYIAVIDALLKLGIAYSLVVFTGDKLVLYGWTSSGVVIIQFLIYFFFIRFNYRAYTFKPLINLQILRKMFSYSAWNLWGSTAYMLKDQGINILLNMFFGPVVNAARGIACQVNVAANSLMQNFSVALNPQIIKSYASSEFHRMNSLIFGGAKLSFYLLLFLSVPILLKTNYILSLWLVAVPQYAVIFTQLIIIHSLLESYTYVIGGSIQATGKIKWYQIIVGGLLLLNLPFGYILVSQGYPPYATLIVAIGLALISLLIRIVFLKKMLNISIIDFLFRVVGLTLSIAIASLFLTYLIMRLMPLVGILDLLFTVLISALITSILIWVLGLNRSEKNIIYTTINNNYKIIKVIRKIKCISVSLFILISIIAFFGGMSTIPKRSESLHKIVHISIDDVYSCLLDLKDNKDKYQSLFEQPFFAELKKMHEKYDAKFSLYVYEYTPDFQLSEMPIKYRPYFEESSSWLKLGYHSISPEFNDSISRINFFNSFKNVSSAIDSFAGQKSRTHVLRLHHYYASDNMVSTLRKFDVEGLLGADDDERSSYNLSKEESSLLYQNHFLQKDSIRFFQTDLRVERMLYFPLELWQYQDRDTLVVFTHEWALNRINRLKLRKSIEWFFERNYKFSFLQ